MTSVCFYFQVHQPIRVKQLNEDHVQGLDDLNIFDRNNLEILSKICSKCYLPTNKVILELINTYPEFKVSYSISGVLLDLLEKHFPEVIKSFQDLAATGKVEFLNETYYHSLSFLYSKEEFKRQVEMHRQKINELFGYKATTFRNTELIYSNDIASFVENMGFNTILAEGADHLLGWDSPNHLFRAKCTKQMNVLLRNYKLADDIAFKFSSFDLPEYPRTADIYAERINAVHKVGGEIINLFMDYETFGEHKWAETGIFEFLKWIPKEILKYEHLNFINPRDAHKSYDSKSELDVPEYMSWADFERDTSAWASNNMQLESLERIYSLEEKVFATNNQNIINIWRYLLTSDHFYYMCTKKYGVDETNSDEDVHNYFSPFGTPNTAYLAYKKAVDKLEGSL